MEGDGQAPTTKGAFAFFQQAEEPGGASGRGRPPLGGGGGLAGRGKSSVGGGGDGLFRMPDIQLNPIKGVIGDFVAMVNNSVRLEVRDLYRILQSCEARKLYLGPSDMELLFTWFEEFEILCVDLFEMEEDLLFAFIERNDHLSRYDRVWSGEGDKLKGALCEAKRTLAKGSITAAFAKFNDLEDEFCGRPVAQVFPSLAPVAEELANAVLSFVALKDQELPPALQTRFSEKEIRAQEKKYWAEAKVMEHSDVILSLATRSMTPDERARWKARASPSRAAILGLRTSGAELYARFERCHFALVTESEELVEVAKAERAKLIEASKVANGAAADRENLSSVIELQLAKIKEDSEAAAAKAARRKLGPLRALKSPKSDAGEAGGSTPASPDGPGAVEEVMSPVSEVGSPSAPVGSALTRVLSVRKSKPEVAAAAAATTSTTTTTAGRKPKVPEKSRWSRSKSTVFMPTSPTNGEFEYLSPLSLTSGVPEGAPASSHGKRSRLFGGKSKKELSPTAD